MAPIAAKAKKGMGGLVSGGRSGNTKQATIRPIKAGASTSTGPKPVVTVLAKKASGPIAKVTVQAGVKATRSLAAAATTEPAMRHALTKNALLAKQAKKTTQRKQGGIRFGTLSEQQLKSLANRQEAGPSSAE